MKLIKVETQGFKSFADRTILKFDGGVVGIVGPNGSGKSNINDAIRWVLGEKSAKNLRGDKMEDVIFAGSKTVKALNFAEVSLTFDNSKGNNSIPHKKIVITRILRRGKSSNEYYVNGDLARYKDIQDIAMETGIGKSSLAIISQGTVQEIANSNPLERRIIFEEASGISKYKSRKKQTLSKLLKTEESLEKIDTIVLELEKRLTPLKKQADKAIKFRDLKSELKNVEIGLISYEIQSHLKNISTLNSELESFDSVKEDLETKVELDDAKMRQNIESKSQKEHEIRNLENDLEKNQAKLREAEISFSKISQQREMILNGTIKVDSKARIAALKEELESLNSSIFTFNSLKNEKELEIIDKKENVTLISQKISDNSLEIEKQTRNKYRLQSKKQLLIDQRDNKSNLFVGVKTIIKNKTNFKGVYGIVSDLIEVDTKFQPAIESVISGSFQNIVVEDSDIATKLINFLKKNKSGRATFIPLETVKPKRIQKEIKQILFEQEGFIGIGSDLIKGNYTKLNEFILGNVIVADTIENANKISSLINRKFMVVSLEGDIVRIGGVLSGGQRTNSKNILGIDEQIEKIEKLLPSVEETIKKIKLINDQIIKNKNSIENQIGEINLQRVRLIEKHITASDHYSTLYAQYKSLSDEELNFDSKLAEVDEKSITLLESEKDSLLTVIKVKKEEVIVINNENNQIILSKSDTESKLRNIISETSEKSISRNKSKIILENHSNRLMQEYEITIEASKDFKLTMDFEEARSFVEGKKQELKNIGNVNMDSILEFEEINERYQTFIDAKDELQTAINNIVSTISQLDKIMIKKLKTTFTEVNAEMGKIFRTLFGGGSAELKFTDPSNLLETGVDIIAQPPGKSVKSLKLLSGGEKALVAISLLFSILKAKPLPLCILDEVEAALDDSNVIRYANFLQELKDKTQFLVVTHRAGTMSRVDSLFGATMQKRGVTSFFSVKLEEAKKLID
ncbi:MAG: AAA family ATPase [Mollicutes bacterium PWAP]|nr:AAA family ATPase [Mollicutes bacterium PWAP]